MKRKSVLALTSMLAVSLGFSGCGNAAKTNAPKDNGKKEVVKQDLKKVEVQVIKAEKPNDLPDGAKNRKGTFVMGGMDCIGKFNPIGADADNDQRVADLIFDSLVWNDDEGKPTPGIAESWEAAKDGKSIIYKLRKDVKYSDGSELTAEDVAFTFTAMCDPKYDGLGSSNVNILEGYKEYHDGNAETVKGIQVIDKNTIKFCVADPCANIILNFSSGIMPKKVYDFKKGNYEELKKKYLQPVGAGAYKLKSFKPGQEVILEANPTFYKGEPKVKTVVCKKTNAQTNIQELKAGGTDVDQVGAKPENVEMLKSAGFLEMRLFPGNSYGYIGFNLRNDFFKDKRVRQALIYGLQRHKLVDSYFKGYADVCNQPCSPVSWAYNDKVNEYKYDFDKACKLLDEAGWVKKDDGFRYKDGKKFEIRWALTDEGKYHKALMNVVKEDWKKLGIDVIFDAMEWGALVSKVYDERKFDIYDMSWILSTDPDNYQIFHSSQDVPGGSNSIGLHNDELDKLLEAGRKELDFEKRKEICQKINALINEEAPYVFDNIGKDMYVLNPRVKNFHVSSFVKWTYNFNTVELVD